MTLQQQPDVEEETLTEDQVVDYLLLQPDFFVRQPDLLTNLVIPHQCGGAASLIERQVEVLRVQNQQYKTKLNQLLQVARENDHLYARIQNLTLSLLEQSDLTTLLSNLQNCLQKDFEVDAVILRIWNEHGNLIPECLVDQIEPKPACIATLCAYLEEKKPLCGKLSAGEHAALFGEKEEQVHSSAIIPLQMSKGKGILVLGSHDKHRFQEGMGFLFLSYIGKLVSKLCAMQC